MNNQITNEKHYGINILRDDLSEGGTKSILLRRIEKQGKRRPKCFREQKE